VRLSGWNDNGEKNPVSNAVEILIRYEYVALFLAVLVEQIGLPVPSAPLLIAAGALAGLHRLNLLAAVAMVVAACLVGDCLWFQLGKRRGYSIWRYLYKSCPETDVQTCKARFIYHRYVPQSILLAKFVPGLSTIAPPMAGLFKLATWKFVVLDSAAALLWAVSYMALGWIFRGQVEILGAFLERFLFLTGVVIALALALYIALKYVRRRRFDHAL
jgi:membrane protein DedA with SNARE-associated domain